MVKPALKTSLFFVLIILISFQQSSTQVQERNPGIQKMIGAQDVSKSLEVNLDYGNMPLYFIPNKGQVDEMALFYTKTSSYTLWLTKEGFMFDSKRKMEKQNSRFQTLNPENNKSHRCFICERDVSRLVFLNANRNPEVVPIEPTEHRVNYLIGNDKSKWRINIPTSRTVLYKELYENIDLKVYGCEKQVEYDFVVKPGGDASKIRFAYRNVGKTKIDKDGNLVVETKFGETKHAKPVCYQVINGEKVEVKAQFIRIDDYTHGFQIRDYNKNYELIIDPWILAYSTSLGGSDHDLAKDIAVDAEGSVYIAGFTGSSDFPTQSPIQGTLGGGLWDAFITKINSAGDTVIYSTYLGGSGADGCYSIAVDSGGAAYVTGSTMSSDFPTQSPIYGSSAGDEEAFIAKINSSGTALVYSTYLGGSDNDEGFGIAVDSEGSAYVTGYTESTDFPTQSPIYGSPAGDWDAFITKINSTGTALVYSTYLGGSDSDEGSGIAVDSESSAYVTGNTGSSDFPTLMPVQGSNAGGLADAFITKISSSGSSLLYSTYLGGSEGDFGSGIAVDSTGAAYVSGSTESSDFPTQSPIQGTYGEGLSDAFVAKINSSGNALVYSTYLGGSNPDFGKDVAVNSEGAAYVAGNTFSTDFPTQSSVQENNAGNCDVFIANLDSSGNALDFSTYLGGSDAETGSGIGVDSNGAAYVTGSTESSDFSIQNPIQESQAGGARDVFVAKLCLTYSLIINAGTGGTTDPTPGTYPYCSGTGVSVRAVPNSGYTFSGWSGDASGTTNPITITLNSDKTITASFTATSSGGGDDTGGGGCFIATAAHGSPLHPHVRILKSFRDKYLMRNKFGRELVDLYYRHSPAVADIIAEHNVLKFTVRINLLPLVIFSYSMVYLGPIMTTVMLFLFLSLPVFSARAYRRRMRLYRIIKQILFIRKEK